jgi:hypothetical protein
MGLKNRVVESLLLTVVRSCGSTPSIHAMKRSQKKTPTGLTRRGFCFLTQHKLLRQQELYMVLIDSQASSTARIGEKEGAEACQGTVCVDAESFYPVTLAGIEECALRVGDCIAPCLSCGGEW